MSVLRHRLMVLLLVFALIFTLFAIPSLNRPESASAQAGAEARVIVYELNVRDQPSQGGALVGQYTINMMVTLEGREVNVSDEGDWVFTSNADTGISGWVLAEYLSFPYGFSINSLPIAATSGQNRTTTTTTINTPTTDVPAPTIEGALGGVTARRVNFRTGPGLGYAIIRTLPAGTPVNFTGRNSVNSWFQGVVDGQEGWLYYTLITISGDVSSLPVIEVEPPSGGASGSGSGSVAPPSGVVSNIGSRSRQIFLAGQAQGNRADVFSKVGDSITASGFFLRPIGVGGLQLHGYTYLQPVVSYFSQTPARTHNSFANDSIAARGGWTTIDVLNPALNVPGVCQPSETPLACEYRVSRPAVALIMFGTNDVARVDSAVYRQNLQTIVQTSIDMGVIPVLSTIPDNVAYPELGARVLEFNGIIRSVARANGTPLWDYWQSMQTLPNHGLSGDGYHPSFDTATNETAIFSDDGLRYGYNMRNLTALMVLDAIWRNVLY